MTNNYFVIKNFLCTFNDILLAGGIFNMSICNSRYICHIVCNFFLRMNIGVEETVALIRNDWYSCQGLFLSTFYKFTIHGYKLTFCRFYCWFICFVLSRSDKIGPIVHSICCWFWSFNFWFRNCRILSLL